MTDNNGRGFTGNEARDTRLRVYPVAGTPVEGDGVRVNAALDLEFAADTGFAADDIVIDDADFTVVVDEATGTVVVAG